MDDLSHGTQDILWGFLVVNCVLIAKGKRLYPLTELLEEWLEILGRSDDSCCDQFTLSRSLYFL